mgnify:CR=1 FL=1
MCNHYAIGVAAGAGCVSRQLVSLDLWVLGQRGIEMDARMLEALRDPARAHGVSGRDRTGGQRRQQRQQRENDSTNHRN